MNKSDILKLRKQAHKLNPVVIIGSQGLTQAVQDEISTSLDAHELIKIRVHTQSRELVKSITNEICEKQQATLIQIIGHAIVVYRKNPDANN